MGQDRQFTKDEVKFALETVKYFKDCWEYREKSNLEADVNFKIENQEFDYNYKKFFEVKD
jgi:hypothetical protein